MSSPSADSSLLRDPKVPRASHQVQESSRLLSANRRPPGKLDEQNQQGEEWRQQKARPTLSNESVSARLASALNAVTSGRLAALELMDEAASLLAGCCADAAASEGTAGAAGSLIAIAADYRQCWVGVRVYVLCECHGVLSIPVV